MHPSALFVRAARHAEDLDRLQDAKVVQRMNVAGHDLGHGAHDGAVERVLGQESGLGVRLLEPLEDGEALGKHAIADIERRRQTLRVHLAIARAPLFAAGQVDRRVVVGQPFEVQADPHAVGRRRPPHAVQRVGHRRPWPRMCSSGRAVDSFAASNAKLERTSFTPGIFRSRCMANAA